MNEYQIIKYLKQNILVKQTIYPNYLASTYGIIFSKVNGKKLKPLSNSYNPKTGYIHVTVKHNNTKIQVNVHQLIFQTFTNYKRSNQLHIDHRNENKLDNNLYNLQLLTARQNISKNRQLSRQLPTGVTKVYTKYHTKYIVHLHNNNKTYHLGTFDSILKAHFIYQIKLQQLPILNTRFKYNLTNAIPIQRYDINYDIRNQINIFQKPFYNSKLIQNLEQSYKKHLDNNDVININTKRYTKTLKRLSNDRTPPGKTIKILNISSILNQAS